MNARKFFFLIFFILCPFVAVGKSAPHTFLIDPKIVSDVRRMEGDIARFFGYKEWPLEPTSVTYNSNCSTKASFYSNGLISFSCETRAYREGKPFLKENALGEIESFPGYVDYIDTLAHEVGHSFSRIFADPKDPYWAACDADEYQELTEGFATYVAYEILLQQAKARRDYQFERYLAARTARYLIQLQAEGRNAAAQENHPPAIAFSSKSKQYINARMESFSSKKIFLKDENRVADWYPRGMVRVYFVKEVFTKEGFQNGAVKKHFCR